MVITEKDYEAIYFDKDILEKSHYDAKSFSLPNALPQLKMNGSFHIITTFFVHTDPVWSANLWNFDTNKSATMLDLQTRHEEVLSCLKANLAHEVVASVNVLHNSSATRDFLISVDLPRKEKLVLYDVMEDPSMIAIFKFIVTHFLDQNVIILNMDNYLDEGFKNIDTGRLRREKLMYSVTRHTLTKDLHCPGARRGNCNKNSVYVGSHDAFIFNLKTPFPVLHLHYLNFTQSDLGQENILMWFFRKKLGYHVTNPCKVLKVIHRHCANIRPNDRIRKPVPNRYKQGRSSDHLAHFSNQL